MGLDSISFRIRQDKSVDGQAKQTTVHNVGGTLTADGVHQKYMVDIIAHALSRMGMDIGNERFTYTFPFHLK